jgi:hypothetical protein
MDLGKYAEKNEYDDPNNREEKKNVYQAILFTVGRMAQKAVRNVGEGPKKTSHAKSSRNPTSKSRMHSSHEILGIEPNRVK